jgi:hypothetical protein
MKIRNQNGLTLLGFLIVLVIGLFFAYATMRVLPMYLEYHALVNAMNTLVSDPQSKTLPPHKIKRQISTSLWASYASNNIKPEHMRISKKTNGINVTVKYEIREDFLGNIDIVGKFENTVVLR